MKVAFRADASHQMGTGHVMRCLALADAFRRIGADCLFITRTHTGHLIDLIRKRSYEVIELPFRCETIKSITYDFDYSLSHDEWLGCHWKLDAEQTLNVLNQYRPDILVIDHYSIDIRWEQLLQQSCGNILVIDDLADRKHICNFLLDQNWFGDSGVDRYHGLIPQDCKTMLGPKYALLGQEYATLRTLMPPRDGEIRRLLVFMGGSDPNNETKKVIDALALSDFKHLVIDIVVGVNHPDPQSVLNKAIARPATNYFTALPSLAGWMLRADLMISAGGSTSWERMCLGLPAIVISIADNQTATNQAMHKAGYIDFLGTSSQVDSGKIIEAVRYWKNNPEKLKTMSNTSQKLVSGMGADCVCNIVLESMK